MNDRVSLRESVGKAVSYGLAPGTADRIGALAKAGKLGIILWHWAYGGEDRAQEAENLLTRRAAKRLKIRCVGAQKQTYETLRLACKQVLSEWRWPECATCLGVKEVSGEHKRVVCHKCQGSGKRRYEDTERSEAIGVSVQDYSKHWDRAFAVIRGLIIGKDAETGAVIREQLKEEAQTVVVEELDK